MPDILVTRQDNVAIVSLNRPAVRNAVTLGMWRELASIFSGLANDDKARAIVAAFADPENSGKGTIQLEGRMVELLHLDQARRTLAIAAAIA